ncbi:MAG: hypothetical protein CM15mP109_04360 [Candidatus Dadabacteria bacterium]|nr:MAG: hypothetical protein CM15mP109_04360 [Candidatus Dadabacteria bacterium]
MMESGLLWNEEFQNYTMKNFSDVELEHMLADNVVCRVRWPKQFDVLSPIIYLGYVV